MSDPYSRKRTHTTAQALGRNLKGLFRGPSPQPPEASSSPEQPSSPAGSPSPTPQQTNANIAHQGQSPARRGFRDRARATVTELETALRRLHVSTKLCPPIASATGVLVDCIDMVKDVAQASEEYAMLAESLANVVKNLDKHVREAPALGNSQWVQNVASGLHREIEYIQEKKNKSKPKRYTELTQDTEDLAACYRRIELVFQQLLSDAALSTWSISHEHLANTRLESMQPAKMARYDSAIAAAIGRRDCTPNTRMAILEELRQWKDDPGSAKVYWINGMAGTGKTTIAYTLCSELEERHELGASFFCSHELPDCRDATRIIPTIAYQLARFSYPYQFVLCQILHGNPDIATRGITMQFEKLLRDPLNEVKQAMAERTVMIVVDALDECADRINVQIFLDVLFRFVTLLPVRLVVTCRPEPGLHSKLQSQSTSSRATLHLHHIDESVVQSDIETYMTAELASVSVTTIQRLVELSGKLFIFAATLIRYIKPDGSSIRQRRLEAILGATWSQSNGTHKHIDDLYGTVLSTALCNSELEPEEREMMKRVLYAVLCANQLLTVNMLVGLLSTDADSVQLALEPLLSVLCVSGDDKLVSTLHASFPDYMLNKERSGQHYCDPELQHGHLARRCLKTMELLLRFNICGLETSYLLDEQVPDLQERVRRCIPPHLVYACRHWVSHVDRARKEQGLVACCVDFVKARIMFWIEVLNLLRCTPSGINMLVEVQRWLQLVPRDEVDDLLRDAERFVTVASLNVVSQSTPHLYVSVLAQWNRKQPMWMWYGARSRGLPYSEAIMAELTSTTALVTWDEDEISPDNLVFSPNGGHLVLCGFPPKILDPYTGKAYSFADPEPPEGPDERWDDYIWDKIDCAHQVAFTPDSRTMVTCGTEWINVWNMQTGALLAGPFSCPYEPSEDEEVRAALSPDCSRVAFWSWSEDTPSGPTVHVWELSLKTGPTRFVTKCMGCSRPVVFSPDGARIVSDIENELCIWDTTTGHVVLGPFASCTALAFSDDGARIATGCRKGMVCIRDALTGQPTVTPLPAHDQSVTVATFSRDGRQLASASHHGDVKVWDSCTGALLGGPFGTHIDVSCLAFSPDGLRIYVGSRQNGISVWHTRTGVSVHETSQIPPPRVDSVFTPDGCQYVFDEPGSGLYVSDGKTGDILSGPYFQSQNSYNLMSSVAVSCDGRYIAAYHGWHITFWDTHFGDFSPFWFDRSESPIRCIASLHNPMLFTTFHDFGITIWDVSTQTPQTQVNLELCHGPCHFPSASDYSCRFVAFSPCSTRVALMLVPDTLGVWDTQTGERLIEPSGEGEARAYDATTCYSHDGSLVATSRGHQLTIWDPCSGTKLAGAETSKVVNRMAAFSPDGKYIAYSCEGFLHVMDICTGCVVAGPYSFAHDVYAMAYTPDGYLTQVTNGGRLYKWKLCTEDIAAIPNAVRSWTTHGDGWVTGPNSERLLWVAPDRLKPKRQKVEVMHDRGPFGIDFGTAAVGTRWTECYQSGK